jgi:hypothetical protein
MERIGVLDACLQAVRGVHGLASLVVGLGARQ